MPQPFKNAVMTCSGALLLTRAQAGEIQIEFTRIAVGNGTYTEEEKTLSVLQEQTGLKDFKNSYQLSSVEVFSEYSVKVTALITNQDPVSGERLIAEGYFINEMGLYAKVKDGGDETEVLYSIAVTAGEHGDFMPPYNGFHAAQIIQEYYATVSNSAEVAIQASGAVVLVQDFEKFKKYVNDSLHSIESRLQWLINILCSYHYDEKEKKIVSFLPHDYADRKLVFPEGAASLDGSKIVLQSTPAGSWPPIPGTGTGTPDIGSGTEGTGSLEEIAAAAAKIVEGNMVEIEAGQVKNMFRGEKA